MYEDDLDQDGTGGPTFRRTYSNLISHTYGEFGPSWTSSSHPRVLQDPDGYRVRPDATRQVAYTTQPDTSLLAIRAARETLTINAGGDLVFVDPTGATMVFHGFGTSIPVAQRGRLKRLYTAGGSPTAMTYNGSGQGIEQARPLQPAEQSEVISFTYDAGSGKVTVAERKLVVAGGGDPTVIRRAEYGYDTVSGQLRSVVVKNAAQAELRRFHYRYYATGETGGGAGLLKHAVGPRTYARMVAQSIDPETATDAVIATWADKSFQYDTDQRVTQQVLRTPDVDGSGTFGYAYVARAIVPSPVLPNDWIMQTIETQPDLSTNLVFTNQAGDVIFKQTATSEGVVVSAEAWHFDDHWRATWHFTPAAMQAANNVYFSTTYTDVIGKVPAQGAWDSGNSPYVRDGVGLIERWTYHEPSGQVEAVMQQIGETGTATLLKRYTYTGHSTP